MINFFIICLVTIIPMVMLMMSLRFIKKNFFDVWERQQVFKNLIVLLDTLKRAENSAFEIIFQQHIIVNIVSNQTLTNKEILKARREYIDYVVQMAGTSIVADMILLLGDYDSFTALLSHDFTVQYTESTTTLTQQNKNFKEQTFGKNLMDKY